MRIKRRVLLTICRLVFVGLRRDGTQELIAKLNVDRQPHYGIWNRVGQKGHTESVLKDLGKVESSTRDSNVQRIN